MVIKFYKVLFDPFVFSFFSSLYHVQRRLAPSLLPEMVNEDSVERAQREGRPLLKFFSAAVSLIRLLFLEIDLEQVYVQRNLKLLMSSMAWVKSCYSEN